MCWRCDWYNETDRCHIFRWLWSSLQRHYRFKFIRKEEQLGPTSSGEFGIERGDRGHTCLDAKVYDTRRVGKKANAMSVLHLRLSQNMTHRLCAAVNSNNDPKPINLDSLFKMENGAPSS